GIPVGNHRARQITQADFENFDYIVAMDRANVRNLQAVAPVAYRDKISKLLSYAGIADDIADPWYTGNFDETYEDVMTGCKALLKKIRPF
ncbi:MAG: low molecular weight phosphotyrosine protein phosphatase, partial [Candidatus Treponema excrementipullorum]|nr:low molecular weight phosphotyrosine protein phosphatase [Candidatus Treponema excrementipullorum]